jgi:hypothetical protein
LITSINEFMKPMMAEVSIPLELILDFYKGIITAKYKKHQEGKAFLIWHNCDFVKIPKVQT